MPVGTATGYIAVSIVTGFLFGVFLQKGRFCFVSAIRDFVAFKDTRVLKGVLAGIGILMIFWSTMAAAGYFRGFWIPPWGLTSLIGGLIFGFGMTMAGGCASGTLYRCGQGYVQFWITLFFMGVGFVLVALAFPYLQTAFFEPLRFGDGTSLYISAPWSPAYTGIAVALVGLLVYSLLIGRPELPERPDRGVEDRDVAQLNVAVLRRPIDATAAGLRKVAVGTQQYARGFVTDDRPVKERLQDSWDARTAGLGLALTACLWFAVFGAWTITGSEVRWAGWLLEQGGIDAEGIEYFGSIMFLGEGISVTIDMIMIAFLIVGAFTAAIFSGDFRIRWPKLNRIHNPIVGGLLMGVGARLAPGCNIANLFSGVALLSAHSIIAGTGMVIGTYIMTRWMYRDVGCAY